MNRVAAEVALFVLLVVFAVLTKHFNWQSQPWFWFAAGACFGIALMALAYNRSRRRT